jgi:hypothetical protein
MERLLEGPLTWMIEAANGTGFDFETSRAKYHETLTGIERCPGGCLKRIDDGNLALSLGRA